MLVIFNTWTRCFATSVFSPGGSRHALRQASSRAQHRQYRCPKRSCCSRPSSSEEKPVEGVTHTCSWGSSEVFMCSAIKSWAQRWGWDTVLLIHALPTPALVLSFLWPWTYVPHLILCLLIYTTSLPEPSLFLLHPSLSSDPFPLLLLLPSSCQIPHPSLFNLLSLEANLLFDT